LHSEVSSPPIAFFYRARFHPSANRRYASALGALLLTSCGFSELDGLSGAPQSDAAAIGDAANEAASDAGVEANAPTEDATGKTDAPLEGGSEEAEAGPDDGGTDAGDASSDEGSTDGGDAGADGAVCSSPQDGSTRCACDLGWSGTSCESTGLGLYWKFDDTSGMVAVDSSGNGLAGQYLSTTTVSPLPAPGVVPASMASWDPASLSFQRDATQRQAVMLSHTVPNFQLVTPANDMTISVWYKVALADLDEAGSEIVSLGDHYILRLGKTASNYRLEFNKYVNKGPSGGQGHVQCLHNFPIASGTPPFIDGNWHHVAAVSTRVAPGSAIYLDGAPAICDQILNAAFMTGDIVYAGLGSDFYVGRHGYEIVGAGTHDFQGNIDELRFYDRVLSTQEIQALAQGVQLPPR
jgi:Concanavalin A-like lectin/glucanases superfamily